jgi:hypothetical protein
MVLGPTQHITEMSTRNLHGGKERQARKADNLTDICEPIFYKMWQPRRLTTLWASTACYTDSFTLFLQSEVVYLFFTMDTVAFHVSNTSHSNCNFKARVYPQIEKQPSGNKDSNRIQTSTAILYHLFNSHGCRTNLRKYSVIFLTPLTTTSVERKEKIDINRHKSYTLCNQYLTGIINSYRAILSHVNFRPQIPEITKLRRNIVLGRLLT